MRDLPPAYCWRACLFALAVVLLVGCSSGSNSVGVPKASDGVGEELPDAPDNLRSPVLVSGGSSAFVVGSGASSSSGDFSNPFYIFDGKTMRWTKETEVPANPPLDSPAGVWTGSELILVGMPCRLETQPDQDSEGPACASAGLTAFAYDPAGNGWREISAPEVRSAEGDGVRREAIGWDGSSARFVLDSSVWSYAPNEDRWSAGASLDGAEQLCVSGGQVVSSRTPLVSQPGLEAIGPSDGSPPAYATTDDEYGSPVVSVLGDDNEWTPLPAPPVAPGSQPARLSCLGESLLVSAANLSSAALTTDGRVWVAAGPPEPPKAPLVANQVWTGQRLILWDGIGAIGLAFEPKTSVWESIPPGPVMSNPVGAAESIVGLGFGSPDAPTQTFVVFTPDVIR